MTMPVIPPTLPANLMTPGVGAAAPGAMPGAGQTQGIQNKGVEFGQKLAEARQPDAVQAIHAPQPANPAALPAGVNPLNQIEGIRGEITSIRQQYEQKVARGELKPGDPQLETWRLLDLQTRAQDVAFRVELVTKIVEHGVGGVKQLSQTQA